MLQCYNMDDLRVERNPRLQNQVKADASSLSSYGENISEYLSGSFYPAEFLYTVANGESEMSRFTTESECLRCIQSATVPSVVNMTVTIEDVTNVSKEAGVTDIVYYDHEDQLYDVPLSIIILLSLLYGGISVAALIGNMLVLWVVTVSRRMRTVTNMMISNLALADLALGLFAIPFQFQAALLQRWNLPEFMCSFCPFIQVLSVNVSVFTLSAIAMDRYRAVMYPLLSARASKRKATWAILSIWLLGLIIALPAKLDYKVVHVEEKGGTKPFCTNQGLSVTFRTYYTLGLVVIQYFFPLIIITGAYAHMATKLWGATAPGNKEESRDAVVLRNKKKVIKMLALVVLLFALCWLPLQTYYFLSTLIPSINGYQYINIIWFCFHWMAMSNSCCNPFIYAIYNDKFQREFRARLWCVRLWKPGQALNGGGLGAPNCSECSDTIDRSKIRATYRFTNNRFNSQTGATRSSIYNTTSFYGGSSGRNNGNDGSRSSSLSFHNHNRLSPPTPQNHEGNRYNQRQRYGCGGVPKFLEVSEYTCTSSDNGLQNNGKFIRVGHANFVPDEYVGELNTYYSNQSGVSSSSSSDGIPIAAILPENHREVGGNRTMTVVASNSLFKL